MGKERKVGVLKVEMTSWSLGGGWKEQGPWGSGREVDRETVPLRQVMTWNGVMAFEWAMAVVLNLPKAGNL